MVDGVLPMRIVHLVFLSMAFLCILFFSTVQAEPNVDENNVALKGYDPVSYHQGTPVKGTEGFSVVYDGVGYYFRSEKNRETFLNDPKKYLPAYGGWCAWAMLEGEKVDVDPLRYKSIGGNTYLFYDRFFVNTLKKWNQAAENTAEAELIEKAAANWLKLANEPS